MNDVKNYGSDVSSLESDEYSNNDAIKIASWDLITKYFYQHILFTMFNLIRSKYLAKIKQIRLILL